MTVSDRILLSALIAATLLSRPVPSHAQNRRGSDPTRANFATSSDPRRLPNSSRALERQALTRFTTPPDPRSIAGGLQTRVITAQPSADPARIFSPAAHLQRFPPPPSVPAFPATFTIGFPSLRDGVYAPDLVRDQMGQPMLRTRPNRLEDRINLQR